MVQFQILSGKRAGVLWSARRFPVRVGRSAEADLRLEEDGVWDEHLQLTLHREEGFVAVPSTDALLHVNGAGVGRTILRNGDILQIGSVKLRFWISPARQSGFRIREWLTWAGISALVVGQILLICILLRQ